MLPVCRYTEISGFQGILAGLLVALKQIIPDTEVTLLQVFKLRAKVRHSRNPAPFEREPADPTPSPLPRPAENGPAGHALLLPPPPRWD